MSRHAPWRGVIEEFRERLPVTDATPVVTLARRWDAARCRRRGCLELTGCEVHLKVEGLNPTGSFKDRGMTMAISKAAEEGVKAVICASTGNTSASAAAYAVRAGMVCAVLVPSGKIAMGKLAQALVHGARLLQVDGNFDDCLNLARDLADKYPVSLVNSVNEFRIEGQKTAAFEICDALGDAPDVHCLPVGNAGNITAYWKGYVEYAADGIVDATADDARLPGRGRRTDRARRAGALNPSTIATAIRIGNPASWQQAIAARDESGGAIEAVTDRDILAAYRLLAREEGVFVEPASAASVAGLLQAHREGTLDAGLQRRVHRHRQRVEGPGVGDRRRARADHHRGRCLRRRCSTRSVDGSPIAGRRFGLPRCGCASRRRVPTSVPASTHSALRSALYDDVVVRVTDEPGLSVDVAGMGAASVPRNARHLVVRSMRATFKLLGGAPAGLEVVCANRIPHGRGLGSSAAAIVAGVVAARGLVVGGNERMDDDAALALAASLEGHPDNVAACLLGGLTIAWTDGHGARAIKVPVVGCAGAGRVRPGFELVDQGGAQAAAGLGAARRRGRQRGSGRAAGRGAAIAARTC